MCGIVGYSLKIDRLRDEIPLRRAVQSIAHRGPDSLGTYYDKTAGVGLGHARLSIIDVSEGGSQPMIGENGREALVYNGELYDFLERKKKLVAEGYPFKGESDTEVLLAMLIRYGVSSLSEMNGIFAFAYFDEASGALLLARDAYGVKPLYFCEDERGVFFGSEARALIAMGVEIQPPDPLTAAQHVSYIWSPNDTYISANIRKLNPGEAMEIRSGRIVRKWSWFSAPALTPKPKTASVETLCKELVEHLRSAVHRQMISDVPLGAFLSGGLDSSSVVAFATQKNPAIECFTISAPGAEEEGMAEDLPYARKVATLLKAPLHVVEVEQKNLSDDLRFMVNQLEDPLADPACLNVYYISRYAREKGIKVLLSGAGGDDLFTGYRRHRAIEIDKTLHIIPSIIRRGISRLCEGLPQKNPLLRRIRKFSYNMHLDGDDRILSYFLWTTRSDLLNLLSEESKRRISEADIERPLKEYLAQMPPDADPIDKALAIEQRFFLADHNLLYTDKMSMACGVEVRVPFLDLELAEFAATVPARLKQKGKEGKWIFKKAMEEFLPADVIYRPKTGFGAPLRKWLGDGLKEMRDDLLSESSIRKRGLFNPVETARLIERDRSGEIDGSYTILSLMCIELWCRDNVPSKNTQ